MENKYCVTCRYCINTLLPTCIRPSLPIDLTTGQLKFALASDERSDLHFIDTCGTSGKYFEPIPVVPEKRIVTWYKKLFNLFDPPTGT